MTTQEVVPVRMCDHMHVCVGLGYLHCWCHDCTPLSTHTLPRSQVEVHQVTQPVPVVNSGLLE